MPSIDPRKFIIVASYLSPGVAVGGAGFAIIGGRVKKVEPKGLRQLQAVYTLLEASDGVGNKALAQQLQQLAVDLAEDAVPTKGRVAATAAS